MRTRAILPTLIVLALAAVAAPGVALADDTTPPVGTLEIENGIGYTADATVTLDVPAVDDVGVVGVRAHLLGGDWTDFPYAPQVEYTFGDASQFAEQQFHIEVEWRDAAGNTSRADKVIWLDKAPPDLQTFKTTNDAGPAGTVTFYVGAYEEGSGVAAVRFSTDDGAHWGAEIPMTDQIVIWDYRDAALGGKPKGLGPVSVKAKVRDGAGRWSNVRSTTVQYEASVHIGVSANPTTGQSITFTPRWSDPVTFPSGTHCMWEFMTGDDQSLYVGSRDDSFSYNMTQGASGGGWCGAWTFTLPWSTVRQYLVAYRVMLPDGSEINAELGGSPGDVAFTATVRSTSPAITTSNLPLFYVLPEDDQLRVGVPATYRGYAIGGASIRSSDSWSVVEEGLHYYAGASTFTFTPDKAGHITVCLFRGAGNTPMDQLGACYDPTVKRATGGTGTTPGATTTAPSGPTPTGATPTVIPGESLGLPSEGPTTPGAVAVGGGQPGRTDGAVPVAGQGPTSAPAQPGSPFALVLIALAVLAGGAALLLRPHLRARIRSRIGR